MLCAPPSKSLEIVSRTDRPSSVFTRHVRANLRTNDPASELDELPIAYEEVWDM